MNSAVSGHYTQNIVERTDEDRVRFLTLGALLYISLPRNVSTTYALLQIIEDCIYVMRLCVVEEVTDMQVIRRMTAIVSVNPIGCYSDADDVGMHRYEHEI